MVVDQFSPHPVAGEDYVHIHVFAKNAISFACKIISGPSQPLILPGIPNKYGQIECCDMPYIAPTG